jgi:ATP-binding cassette subfamily B protein
MKKKIWDCLNMESKTKKKKGLARLIQIAGSKKWLLITSMILAVIATIFKFVPIIAVYLIITEIATHATDISMINQAYLTNLAYISLGSVLLWAVFMYISGMLSHIAAFNILYEIRVKISNKLSKLPMGFFNKKASGKIKKIMAEDVERIELFVAHHIPDITTAIVFPAIIIIYLFSVDWRLALAALVPFPIAIGMMVVMFRGRGAKSYQEYHNALENMNSSVVEYVRGMPVVKVFGTSIESFQRLKETIDYYRKWVLEMSLSYSWKYPLFLTIASASLIFIIPVSVFILNNTNAGNEFIPTVLLFLIVGGGFFFPILKMMFVGGYLNQISVGVNRIDEILNMEEIENKDTTLKPKNVSIEFEKVSFAYEKTIVVDNVSFTAKPGTVTALVGPSGAGKTTLGLLTARFWDVESGKIKIGGVCIKDMDLETLMDYVSFVFQDGFLFFDTIEENIRMGNSDASKEEVINAAKAAQCHEFIKELPDGYNTLVGEGGTYLSGGEQQRIGIARLILKNTPIVVMDEATAYADPENEAKILQGLSKLIKNKTVIIIAHRLSTITNADQIIVIDQGKIVEQGTHKNLVEKKGLYSKMWKTYSQARNWKISRSGGA